MPPRPRIAHPHHRVTAVVVSHDGGRWLPDVLRGLATQTRAPQRVVAVDTGSTDGSRDLLAEALTAERVVDAPRNTGYGAALAMAVAHLDATATPPPTRRRATPDGEPPPEPVEWLWLLHDDSAPERDALAALVEAAEAMPSAGVLGSKARDWDDPRLLVEVGLTIDRAGRRETGLERREFDQGQHDSVRDVLAVGSAGTFVRRAVWDDVCGYDPRLPLFRDDVDFGWRANAAGHRVVVVPAARVRHARAASLGRRPIDATHGSAHGVDRRHSLAVLLANLPLLAALAAAPRLLIGAVFRTLGFLLTRQVAEARDEVAAVAWNFAHLPDLVAARRRRRPKRAVPWSALRPLFAGRAARMRGYLEQFGDWITGGSAPEPVPGEDGEDELPPPRTRRQLLTAHPGVTLFAGLLVVPTPHPGAPRSAPAPAHPRPRPSPRWPASARCCSASRGSPSTCCCSAACRSPAPPRTSPPAGSPRPCRCASGRRSRTRCCPSAPPPSPPATSTPPSPSSSPRRCSSSATGCCTTTRATRAGAPRSVPGCCSRSPSRSRRSSGCSPPYRWPSARSSCCSPRPRRAGAVPYAGSPPSRSPSARRSRCWSRGRCGWSPSRGCSSAAPPPRAPGPRPGQ
jgi:GT2 family glycosyltransferase